MSTWWRTKRSEQNGIEPSAATVPTDPGDEAAQQSRMWKLTALPRDEFDLTYGALIKRAWRYVANLPQQQGLPELSDFRSAYFGRDYYGAENPKKPHSAKTTAD